MHRSTTGNNYYVRILSTIDRELLKPNASVALQKVSSALVDVLPPEADSSISMLKYVQCSMHGSKKLLSRGLPVHVVRVCSFVVPSLLTQCHSFSADEKPDVSYADIGGMDIQKQEMREAVELPLTHHDLYKQIGMLSASLRAVIYF